MYVYEKVIFNWVGGTGGKIGLKWGKTPISFGLETESLQFVPETLEHSFTLCWWPIFPLYPKNWQQNWKKNCTFRISLFPPLLASSSPKLRAKFIILLYLPIRFDVNLDYPKFRFHSLCQSKVIQGKPLGGWPNSLVSEGIMDNTSWKTLLIPI